MEHLAAAFSRARRQLGLTPDDIAERLEIPAPYYERVEAGEIMPNVLVLCRLAELLHVPIAELISSTDPSNNTSIC